MFRDSGTLRNGTVSGCRVERFGEGLGFAGQMARLQLEFDAATDAPSSIIAKLPSPIRKNRATLELMQGCEPEVCFFSELASESQIPTAHCYYAAMDPDPFLKNRERDRALIERLPIWLLSFMAPLAMWLAGFSRRRYLVLIEDLGFAETGDQVDGASESVAEQAVRGLARFHAGFRGDPRLASLYWLPSADAMPR